MASFLILRLDGPMQAWGTHTFEDFRPANNFPTRSGLLGLIGACLGIARADRAGLARLAEAVKLTVRQDRVALRLEMSEEEPAHSAPKSAIKLADFHTVLDARKVDGSTSKFPVVSRREYLFDAAFTVAVAVWPGAGFELDRIASALRRPRFTPFLGRRSCPMTRPLLDTVSPVEADDAIRALEQVAPQGGPIYAEGELASDYPIQMRDVPGYGKHRQFGTRRVFVHKEEQT